MIKSPFKKILQIDKAMVSHAKSLRNDSISSAVSWETGPSQENKKIHILWQGNGYSVGVAKPGKEADPKRKNLNKNDMWPFIKKEDTFLKESATFRDVFRELEHMGHKSAKSLELLACLLLRASLMLDHQLNENGEIEYLPPKEVLSEIEKEIPEIFKVPLQVFLQYLDAIALNEDVKYQTRLNSKGKAYSYEAGRPNNLQTCVHLIAVLLGRAELVDFAYGFSQQRGVSALKPKAAKKCFPLLDSESDDEEIK